MEEFTPETLKKFITQNRERRNPDEVLENINKAKEFRKKLEQQNSPIPQNLAELDAQIRNNMVEIIRRLVKTNQKEELKKILEEHKNFIQNILDILQ
ncbi:MAG: hypothetical protein KatS3mg129_0359 [Leptospiraceae bacterium]|nr:MAG: hypothetical protein KatS3mg129_0359 [Leptospiraceae bacterium]